MVSLGRLGVVVAVISTLAGATASCGIAESPRQRATRQAIEGVRRDVDWTRSTMKGLLREGWKFGQVSPETVEKTLGHSFGRRDGTLRGGAIFAMSSEPDGTVHADMVRESAGQAGGGLDYAGTLAAACVRFSGKPGPEPVISIEDIACPNDLSRTDTIIVRVAGSR